MLQSFVIEVTWADIGRGHPAMFKECPVALALSRALGGIASVGREDAFVKLPNDDPYDKPKSLYGTLPEEAQEFISQFDRRRSVVPFTFVWNAEER